MPDYQAIPILVNVRDRVTPLRALVDWLERAGQERIVLLDNASTWPPLLEYLEQSPHEVVRLDRNWGNQSIWKANLLPRNEWFVFTDPDVVPTEDCPLDAVAHLRELLESHHAYIKAGLGLYLDDVPETMPHLAWERSLVASNMEIAPGAFGGNIMVDTTFALHRPAAWYTLRGIRCGYPYQARHTSWYVREPSEEDRYYLAHAIQGPEGSSWAKAMA